MDDETVHATGSSSCKLHVLLTLLALLAGCASPHPESKHFFLAEEGTETHGRKTWLDRFIEADPGGVSFVVAPDYQERPPRKIAVLPFVDKGKGSYLVNKIPLKTHSKEEQSRWSWTHTNRVRRALAGDLAAREFTIVSLLMVDAVLADRGITDGDGLNGVPPEELGRWLDADTVVYGELLDYEAYYGILASSWRVTAHVRMVSTEDGHEVFSCTDRRYSSSVNPAVFPIDILIGAGLSLANLRDITLARTEYEVGREIALSLPSARRNISEIRTEAKEKTRRPGSGSSGAIPQESLR